MSTTIIDNSVRDPEKWHYKIDKLIAQARTGRRIFSSNVFLKVLNKLMLLDLSKLYFNLHKYVSSLILLPNIFLKFISNFLREYIIKTIYMCFIALYGGAYINNSGNATDDHISETFD